MRKIKFRIKNALGYDTFIELKVENGAVLFESQPTVPLAAAFDAESIVQFVGYDEQGREIYESDEVADPFNGEIGSVKLKAQISGEDIVTKNFFDDFYSLKAIKADVLFSAPDLNSEEFKKMFSELLAVRSWFKFGNTPMFEVFQEGRNISICGYFTKKSFGYLQEVLDEYDIKSIVNRVREESNRLSKLTDITGENSIEVEWRDVKCVI